MARKKATPRRIPNDAARSTTFRNLHNDLVKKASELSTFCNVNTCVIVYGEGEAQPKVWPSVDEAVPILHRYKAMTEEGFLRQRMDKLREQVHKARHENRELHTACLVHKAMLGRLPGLKGLTVEEVANVGWMVQMKLKSIGDRIANLQAQAALQLQAQPAPPLTYAGAVAGDLARHGEAPLVQGGFIGGNDASSSTADNMASTSASAGFSWQWPDDTGDSSSSFHPK
ncbi:agamous-like MADS-box protein AGL80 [Brachypodium distachyon]|uniref:agamous-like MADS-box protein AGL80 n=1 Tax=Brachypodium distachyon TaxID=15368 RepID=UPI000234E5E6|nr:agamous-like MADS-box protein AGL80 [Brachypodium distachyon]|eukprot:XP_003565667.1 agamous-like MADS-box protein AGL80 [Brachypodium distachyon]